MVKQITILAKKVSVFKNGCVCGWGHVCFNSQGQLLLSEFYDFQGNLLTDDEYECLDTGVAYLQVIPAYEM